ncbi:high mobility group B protein 6 [Pyrus ussuriensis x Pyrus communis]|uniref:High mobility group B protein 6 n=1 Tax=Pyrus ussuriensis x Pyrus communis TaxID=2448454 RepID=A0A5N5H8R0_9ROSA|nr:high mobility group B protein 6 [Pyrus ussuriensis x Pyrus communis]
MQALQSPVAGIAGIAGNQIVRPRSGRTPLQLKNTPATPTNSDVKIKPVQQLIGVGDDSNKENRPIYVTPVKIEAMDASLAEELSAIRKKMERMKSDRERTEKMLKERDLMMEMQTKELENRGQIQRMLEIELDRIYRLNQLHVRSIRVSPIRSLREKEKEKKTAEWPSQEVEAEDEAEEEMEESVDENSPRKPESCSASSSEIVTEKTEK